MAPKRLLLAPLATLALCAFPPNAHPQTIENPVAISMSPLAPVVSPGARSAILLVFRIPRGFMIGPDDPSSRNPVGTVVEMEAPQGFTFEQPQFPPPTQMGVPVHRGTAWVLQGELHVVIPFTTSAALPDGEYEITARLTYTPGLSAGHIRTHVREPYSAKVTVARAGAGTPPEVPAPSATEVPEDFAVHDEIVELSEPWKSLLPRWRENTPIPRALHWLWIDPENHGKHIQTGWVPFLTLAENTGAGGGVSVEFVDLTREGIMTGFLQLRGYYNEYNGSTAELKAISCPAAYFNYQFSAEISSNGKNRQVHFRNENLTLGATDRFGYEAQLDLSHNPRARFYGLGPGIKEEDKTAYNHKESGGFLDFYWLPVDRLRFGVGGRLRSIDVGKGADNLRKIMPFTTEETLPGGRLATVPGIKGATIVGERVSVIYDSRNSEFAPSAGFYGKLTAGYNQVTDQVITSPERVTQYGRFTADLRKYFSTVDQKWTLLIRNAWTLTTSRNIPFFDQAAFGGGFSDRGFPEGRFYGQHSVFASVEVRYLTTRMSMIGLNMEIELAPFLDVGQVFDSDAFRGRFNVNPGLSVRFLNKPNVGIVSNAAIGQDGFILTGGTQLPF